MPSDLEFAQSALIRALAEGRVPTGFDAKRMNAAGAVLRRKRRALVASVACELRYVLGAEWARRFDEYARASPRDGIDAVSDAERFVAWLAARGELTDDVRAARFELRLRWRFGFHVAVLAKPRRLMVGYHLPVFGCRAVTYEVRWEPSVRP
jgi:hypothetical protein